MYLSSIDFSWFADQLEDDNKGVNEYARLFSIQVPMDSEKPQQQVETNHDVEKLVERAKQLKEDLDMGKGWTQRYHVFRGKT